ncbi:hypothetical protein CN090_20340 [Sinorhizobium meliloti]|nr:hypothetical protein CN234_17615 [Sinorhizobium meliloti]RVG77603.1 hypothetical protein CN219_29675 [Sinorhizobium meliloti]RVH67973.1 hypothetical protein CN203_34750 [Sinorhizobium meliloti]RVI31165.1 hypothetical protein CN197_21420 [Sinorhizobium meliloti]RVI42833.1 hypothetical protein CN196_20750 [Sinorhizobium meliloti]
MWARTSLSASSMGGGELEDLRPDLVGDGAPLSGGGSGVSWARRGDEGGDDTPAALAGVSKNLAHEVDPGAVDEVLSI